ncbi:MAG TPA: hypothetical protein HPP77_09445 [Candidatus Hydrogenedentes bacterium]|nr:hypothetical protein [Candidatus Hydrogenedentota bacterium]
MFVFRHRRSAFAILLGVFGAILFAGYMAMKNRPEESQLPAGGYRTPFETVQRGHARKDELARQIEQGFAEGVAASSSSGLAQDAFLEKTVGRVMREVDEELTRSQDGSEQIKAALNDILARGDGYGMRKLLEKVLLQKANEEEKEWLREALLERIKSDPDPKIRRQCLTGISYFREIAHTVCADVLRSDPDLFVREIAAHKLGFLRSEEEIDLLLTTIEEVRRQDGATRGDSSKLAVRCIESLGDIGGRQANEALMALWESEDLPHTWQRLTLEALGKAGDIAMLEVFQNVLQGGQASLEDVAVVGLGRLAGRNSENREAVSRARQLLREKLQDADPYLQGHVLQALAYVGTRDDIPLIESFLDDESSRVVTYTEDGEEKEKTVYPLRRDASRAIDAINKRLNGSEQ